MSIPDCREMEKCARFGSNYCLTCRTVTEDDRDNDYYFRESGD